MLLWGIRSSLGGIVLLLWCRVAPGGGFVRARFSALLVSMGAGREGLGSESNRITPACPRDVAIIYQGLYCRGCLVGWD